MCYSPPLLYRSDDDLSLCQGSLIALLFFTLSPMYSAASRICPFDEVASRLICIHSQREPTNRVTSSHSPSAAPQPDRASEGMKESVGRENNLHKRDLFLFPFSTSFLYDISPLSCFSSPFFLLFYFTKHKKKLKV